MLWHDYNEVVHGFGAQFLLRTFNGNLQLLHVILLLLICINIAQYSPEDSKNYLSQGSQK